MQLHNTFFSVCGLGQQIIGDECMLCPQGSYNDKEFHRDEQCQNCSGTKTNTIKHRSNPNWA